jgi:hypothetical protein
VQSEKSMQIPGKNTAKIISAKLKSKLKDAKIIDAFSISVSIITVVLNLFLVLYQNSNTTYSRSYKNSEIISDLTKIEYETPSLNSRFHYDMIIANYYAKQIAKNSCITYQNKFENYAMKSNRNLKNEIEKFEVVITKYNKYILDINMDNADWNKVVNTNYQTGVWYMNNSKNQLNAILYVEESCAKTNTINYKIYRKLTEDIKYKIPPFWNKLVMFLGKIAF